jgi:peptidoglycan/xylan/chitin deacetylase (PgdA/CDA1 family)
MDWLVSHGQCLTVDSLLEGDPQDEDTNVCLTFDDGYASVRDYALPILKSRAMTATVYVNTGRMGNAKRLPSDPKQGHYPNDAFMTWDDVAALFDDNWTIGSHGVEHLDLCALPSVEVCDQLERSKSMIEDRLCKSCDHFAYTWGRYNSKVKQAVENAGYASAAAGYHGRVTIHSDRFAFPRIDVRAEYSLSDFVSLVTGAWDYIGLKHRFQLARS